MLSFIIQAGLSKIQISDKRLVESFVELKSEQCMAHIVVNGTYNKGYIDKDEIDRVKEYIKDNADLAEENISICEQEGSFYIAIEADYEMTNDKKCAKELIDKRETIKKLCKETGFTVKDYISVEGDLHSKLTKEQMEDISNDIFEKLDCDIKEKAKLASEKMDFIYYSFSPLLESKIIVGKKEINITIAFTYDEEKDVTKIYIATPLLNQSI